VSELILARRRQDSLPSRLLFLLEPKRNNKNLLVKVASAYNLISLRKLRSPLNPRSEFICCYFTSTLKMNASVTSLTVDETKFSSRVGAACNREDTHMQADIVHAVERYMSQLNLCTHAVIEGPEQSAQISEVHDSVRLLLQGWTSNVRGRGSRNPRQQCYEESGMFCQRP
jgi:hypothetical protein